MRREILGETYAEVRPKFWGRWRSKKRREGDFCWLTLIGKGNSEGKLGVMSRLGVRTKNDPDQYL
jgi:hypothetical protein